jgi:hypothetical protein
MHRRIQAKGDGTVRRIGIEANFAGGVPLRRYYYIQEQNCRSANTKFSNHKDEKPTEKQNSDPICLVDSILLERDVSRSPSPIQGVKEVLYAYAFVTKMSLELAEGQWPNNESLLIVRP